MGLRNFLNRRSRSTEVQASSAVAPDAPVEQEPLTAGQLSTEQLEDLDAARAELLQLAAEVGVKSLNACPRDGSRWQDDPATIRTITAVLREAHLEEQRSLADPGPAR
ncbi:hypothetical protein [Paenarthrobacter nitroguajacolicus]|uniref:hypothetical protein n=1 Tax=Paenarthrobacter nitroguajacolicus TaxID=211146 RepID=UPI00248D3838|nr:hypothetical protein [Paenarthrobacter nitroguajacolicus]MDI2035972.1 hypothetical protein [Paenarthrobacter nitroguajacolicus]